MRVGGLIDLDCTRCACDSNRCVCLPLSAYVTEIHCFIVFKALLLVSNKIMIETIVELNQEFLKLVGAQIHVPPLGVCLVLCL